MILCLTVSDLSSSVLGLVGSLVLEVGDLAWRGSSLGCAAYYFVSSWLVGLSNYLIVCLLSPSLKRVPRHLLLSLLLLPLLPASPELAIRSTVLVSERQSVCILTTNTITHTLYLLLLLAVRHLLPGLLVLLSTTTWRLAGPVTRKERPDILPDTAISELMLQDYNQHKLQEESPNVEEEDPTRKVYKHALTTLFLATNTLSLLAHVISEVGK